MKPSPDQQQIIERMQPGIFCLDGFLGSEHRSLGEILDADNSAVEALGVSHERIAAEMAKVLDRAAVACGGELCVGDHLTAVFHEAMGRIPSPFGDGMFPKGEVELTDERTGKTYRYTPLSVHMIAAHGFYQGRGGRYRIEPEAICQLLEFGPFAEGG